MQLDASKTVLLTGASGGIGRAIARAVHDTGARLILTGRRVEPMQELARETGAKVIPCDLCDRGALERLLGEAGTIDVLVANAGLPASGSLMDFTPEEIDRALDVNLRAPMIMSRVLAPPMMQRGAGHLVFVSSIAGMVSSSATALYSGTKFGLRGFALGLRADLARHGVGVTTIYPGFIRDAGMFAETGVKLPFGVGTRSPEDVADAVVNAVSTNPSEVVVASPEQRVGAWLGSLSPSLVATLERAILSDTLAEKVSVAQRGKR